MTLKQLEAFYWAATCKNFAVAANRLNISVSSLSKRIGELETSLGAQLFDRGARSAAITPLGDQLLPHAKALLTGADQFVQRAGSNRSYSGRCRFGVAELVSLTWLPKFIDAMQCAHPELLVEPFVGVGQLVEDGLEDGELDFAIIAGPSSRPTVASSHIGEAAFSWIAAPTVLEQRPALQANTLSELTLISLPPSSGAIRILDEWLIRYGAVPDRRLTCNSWGAVVSLIKHGLGVGFMPSPWADILCQRGELSIISAFPPLNPLHYTFQRRRDDTRPMLAAMRELAAASFDFQASNIFT